jgi:hypothetical protein
MTKGAPATGRTPETAPRQQRTDFAGLFVVGARRAQFCKARVRASQCRKTLPLVKRDLCDFLVNGRYHIERSCEFFIVVSDLKSGRQAARGAALAG